METEARGMNKSNQLLSGGSKKIGDSDETNPHLVNGPASNSRVIFPPTFSKFQLNNNR